MILSRRTLDVNGLNLVVCICDYLKKIAHGIKHKFAKYLVKKC